jgi:SAM-dependent methyltransferase
MDDDTIEIRDTTINVEEIMATIRENIRRRHAAGEVPPAPDTLILNTSDVQTSSEINEMFQRDLEYINSNWDIRNNNYVISSHRPSIGRFLVKGRELVHGEVCRYVDPIITYQTEFNGSTVRLIIWTTQRLTELDQRQLEMETAFSTFKQEHDQKIAAWFTKEKITLDTKVELLKKDHAENLEFWRHEFNSIQKKTRDELDAKINAMVQERQLINKENLTEIEKAIHSNISDLKIDFTKELNNKILCDRSELDRFIKEFFAQMDEGIHTRTWITHVLEDRIQKELAQKRAPATSSSKEYPNYFLFEERFRGSRKDVTQRQRVFLPYFEKCSCVLDIGCGRGEFLDILKDHAIGGIGVDSDPDMVAYCRSRQLDVEHSDALTYLEKLEDKSLDGIFIDQVVEHMEPDYLIRLLVLCHRKLKFGYNIVVETVNPLSFVSFVNFYIDMTHKRPIHPETLLYLFSASGFRDCEKRFFSPVSDEGRLKNIEGAADMNESDRKNVDVYNQNVEMLNTVLFGAQDYAIVGKK